MSERKIEQYDSQLNYQLCLIATQTVCGKWIPNPGICSQIKDGILNSEFCFVSGAEFCSLESCVN